MSYPSLPMYSSILADQQEKDCCSPATSVKLPRVFVRPPPPYYNTKFRHTKLSQNLPENLESLALTSLLSTPNHPASLVVNDRMTASKNAKSTRIFPPTPGFAPQYIPRPTIVVQSMFANPQTKVPRCVCVRDYVCVCMCVIASRLRRRTRQCQRGSRASSWPRTTRA